MHVSLMAPAQITVDFLAQESRRRGCRRSCIGSPYARADSDWEDRYVIAMSDYTESSWISVAKTVEVDSLRFNDNDLDVVGTLEYGQFGVVSMEACMNRSTY